MNSPGRWAQLAAGLILSSLGVFVPSATWLSALREVPPELQVALLSGAGFFRAGLVLLGLFWVASVFYPRSPTRDTGAEPLSSVAGGVWILASILVAAALGRIHALGAGLWFDEIVTHVAYTGGSLGEIVSTYDSQNQHFLYTLAAKVSLTLFGDTGATLRLPAVLFGVGSLWALVALATELRLPREGLLAAALLAFSYHHVWFSQNARGYTGLMFWTLLSSWMLLRACASRSRRWWVGYALATALGCFTHMTMIFTVTGHFSVYLYRLFGSDRGKGAARFEGLLFGFILAGLLTYQCYAWVVPQMFGGTLQEGGGVAQWKNPLWAFLAFLEGLRVGVVGSLLAAGGSLLFFAGCRRLWLERSPLLGLFFVPVFVGGTVVMGTGHHLWPRFFFFAAGFGALIAILGTLEWGRLLAHLLRFDTARAATTGTVLALIMIAGSAYTVPRAWAPKQDFRGARDYVERIRRTGDSVATVGLAILPYRDYYRTDWLSAESVESLQRLRSAGATTWVVYTLRPHLESFHPEIYEVLKEECPVDARFEGTLGGGTVFVCRLDGPLSAPVELARRTRPAVSRRWLPTKKRLGWAPA